MGSNMIIGEVNVCNKVKGELRSMQCLSTHKAKPLVTGVAGQYKEIREIVGKRNRNMQIGGE